MTDFKLEYTEPDNVYETVDTKPQEQQYRYYEIAVSRKQITWVNVRVPHDKELNFRNSYDIAVAAVDELVRDYDWEDESPREFEVESIKAVTEDEATDYDVYEAS